MVREVISLLWTGIQVGAISSALGIAIVLCFRTTKVLNLAVGGFYLAGAFAYATISGAGSSVGVALLIASVLGAILGVAEEAAVLRRLRGSHIFTQILSTIGIVIVISGVIVITYGKQPTSAPPLIGHEWTTIGTRVTAQGTVLVTWVLVTVMVLTAVLKRSAIGRLIGAVSDDPEGAMMVGIDVDRLRIAIYGFSGAISALTGALAIPLFLTDFTSGIPLSLLGFIAAVLGGGLSVTGAAFGGIAVGIIEASTRRFVGATFAEIFISLLLVVVVVLAVRFPAFRRFQETA